MASGVHAQPISGLRPPTPGARANGMGGTFIAIADDGTASISNPAGLGFLTRPQVYAEITSANNGLSGNAGGPARLTSLSFASASTPVNDKITVGATYYEFFKFNGTCCSGFQLDASGRSYGVSVAANATSSLKLGATVTVDHFSDTETGNPPYSATSAGYELGALWKANDQVSFGITGAHGSEDAGNINRVGFGVAYRPMSRFIASADIVRLQSGLDLTETHIGGEYAIPQSSGTLLLRAGGFVASNDPDQQDRGGTFGVGYAAKSTLQVDLAYVTKDKRVVVSMGIRL